MARKKSELEPKLPATVTSVIDVPLKSIRTGLNVRTEFDEQGMNELTDSVKLHGVLEPVLVCEDHEENGRYILLAGERRCRAAEAAGLDCVPSRIMPALTDQQMIEIMLIENLSRKDLLPLEEAEGFRKLMDLGVKQKDICDRLGRSQSYVSNRIRLLNLPDPVKERISDGSLTPAHAMELLTFEHEPIFQEFCRYLSEMKNLKSLRVDQISSEMSKCIAKSDSDEYHSIWDIAYEIRKQRCDSCDRLSFGCYCRDKDCFSDVKKLSDEYRSVAYNPSNMGYKFSQPLRPELCAGCANISVVDGIHFCSDWDCMRKRVSMIKDHIASVKRSSLDSIYDSIVASVSDSLCSGDSKALGIVFGDILSRLASGDLVKVFTKKLKENKDLPIQMLVSLIAAFSVMNASSEYNCDVEHLDLEKLKTFLAKYSVDVSVPEITIPDDFFLKGVA